MIAILALAALTSAPAAGAHAPPRKISVADGVYLFATPPYSDVGLDGNSTVIVSEDGVLVFDSNGTPAAAAAVLAEVRALTDRPVRYVVNSHWHWDHWYGTEVYRRAFPGVQIVAHEATRRMMAGPAIEFNQPGLETLLPGHVREVGRQLAAARSAAPPPGTGALERHVEADRFFLEQKRGVQHILPTLTFTDSLSLHLGDREIRVLHYDRAVTPGDAFLYLPRERIVVTGDLLVNPISFALSCYPTGWLRTLERIDALDAATHVPGHGEPLRGNDLLRAHIALFRELLRQGKSARERGLDVEQAKGSILENVRELKTRVTRDDPALSDSFDLYLVDWYLHRVYDELAGPLSDAIAPIPRHTP